MKKETMFGIVSLFALALLLASCSGEKQDTTKQGQSEVAEKEIPSLQAKLDEKKAQFEKRASDEIKKLFNDGVQAVAESEAMKTALNLGDTAPDFTLPNAAGENVTLSVVLQNGPVVLTWYRGGW